tara:strand:+ start:168 stop:416 length:249 start_codon:yes stop_codon:yes gene_type:complete
MGILSLVQRRIQPQMQVIKVYHTHTQEKEKEEEVEVDIISEGAIYPGLVVVVVHPKGVLITPTTAGFTLIWIQVLPQTSMIL